MRLIVRAHSSNPLGVPLPRPGQEAIAEVEPRAPERLAALVESLIDDGTDDAHDFATWADLAQAAKRLMTISMFRAVLPAEKDVLEAWRAAALDGSGDFSAAQREISRTWANCGETAKNLLARLRGNYGATLSHVAKDTFTNDDVARLRSALMQKPARADEAYLLDCDLQGIHNFVVEVHSDGSRYLAQGYQGAYSAPWWASDGLYEPTNAATDVSRMEGMRRRYGNGIDMAEAYDHLVAALAAVVQRGFNAVYGDAPAWPQLPFNPDDPNPTKIRDLPYLQVDLYVLRNPQAVYATMPAVRGAVCTQAALSLPIPPPAVDVPAVLRVMERLGLEVSHSTGAQTGDHKFKVTADLTGEPMPQIVNKLLLRVGDREVDVVREADLPAQGQDVEVGYAQRGLECTVRRTVR